MKYSGDSYDIVKRSLMNWLAPEEAWAVQPMFTDDADELSRDWVREYEKLLGAKVLNPRQLTPEKDRAKYFSVRSAGHVLFDPDIGVWMQKKKPKNPVNQYILGCELVREVQERPDSLTLVFDQSYSRTRKCPKLVQKKLSELTKLSESIAKDREVHGIGYYAQAPFLILSCDQGKIKQARNRLCEAGLPGCRIVDPA